MPTRRFEGLRGDLKGLRAWLSPAALAPGSKTRTSISWPNYDAEKRAWVKLSPAKVACKKAKYKAHCATPTP